MTPTQAVLHERSQRFHADIARKAATMAKPAKVEAVQPLSPIEQWKHYPQMWFWELVSFIPRTPRTVVTCHQVGPRVGSIQQAVCREYGISHEDMMSYRRRHAFPRQVAIYISSQITTQSVAEIGRRFGRDHTTVLYAGRKITALVQRDPALAARIENIKAGLMA